MKFIDDKNNFRTLILFLVIHTITASSCLLLVKSFVANSLFCCSDMSQVIPMSYLQAFTKTASKLVLESSALSVKSQW